MPTTRRPTIRDVASAAGVSITTVSRFTNGQQRFSAEVETRIKEAIDKLAYHQNPAARSIVTGQTGTIGLAVLDIRNPHHANIMKGANRVALAHGYSLLVVDMEESANQEQKLLEALAMRVDALIVSARIPDATVDWLATQRKPVSFIGRPARTGVASAGTDGFMAAFMLGRYLVEQGWKRIAYVGCSAARWNAARLNGLSAALAEAQLKPLIFDAKTTNAEAGERIASSVFLGRERPDAVVGCNDLVAMGLMHEAKSLGLRIPEDVAITGFDNIPACRYVAPPLTTVEMRSEEMGEAAMQQVLSMIAGKGEQDSDILLEPRLVIRDSARRPAP